jgi:hypothetical protein
MRFVGCSLALVVAWLTAGCGSAECDKSTDNQPGVCVTRWSNCSDDSEYEVECTLNVDADQTTCMCQLDGVTTIDDVFILSTPRCADAKEVNAGCGWELTD